MEKIILEIDRDWIKPFCESFVEMKSDILVNLFKNNKKYQNLIKEKEKILEEYPNLRNLLENKMFVQLTKEEAKVIYDLEQIFLEIKSIQDEELFIKGIQYGYLIFKKLDL